MNFKIIVKFWFSFFIEIISQLTSLFLPVYFSLQVGIIVDYIYQGVNADNIILQTIFILIIFASFSPVIAYLSAKIFFKKSIYNDKEILQNILKKDISQVRNAGGEGLLQLFDSDLIEYRFALRTVVVSPIVAAILIFQLYWKSENLFFLSLVFTLSSISVFFSKLYSKYRAKYYDNFADFNENKMGIEKNITDNKAPLILFSLKKNAIDYITDNFKNYFNSYGIKDIKLLSFSKSILKIIPYLLQGFIIVCFFIFFKHISASQLASSLFLMYPVQQIIELLIEWVSNIPLVNVLKKRIQFFNNFNPANVPQMGCSGLEIKNLKYKIQNREFNFPDFKVEKNEKVLIDGKNGSGKSTLLKLITGELPKVNGEIIFLNSINSTYIGYVPQESLLFSTGITENITLGKDVAADVLQNLLNGFSLKELIGADFDNEEVKNYSGGEIKKIDIARAVLQSSDLLILDEPTNNLDEKSIEALIKLLKAKTVIFTSHDERLRKMATKIVSI